MVTIDLSCRVKTEEERKQIVDQVSRIMIVGQRREWQRDKQARRDSA